jgi:hypothetical protein
MGKKMLIFPTSHLTLRKSTEVFLNLTQTTECLFKPSLWNNFYATLYMKWKKPYLLLPSENEEKYSDTEVASPYGHDNEHFHFLTFQLLHSTTFSNMPVLHTQRRDRVVLLGYYKTVVWSKYSWKILCHTVLWWCRVLGMFLQKHVEPQQLTRRVISRLAVAWSKTHRSHTYISVLEALLV